MIGKALLNLDQATLHLDPDFAPAEAIRANLSELLTSGLKVSPAGIMAAAIEAKEFTSLLPKRGNRILDALAEGEFTMRVQAIDEEQLHTVLQRVANRVTLGVVIAATVMGAALMMRVPSDHTILGYPALAMGFFLFAVLAGAALVIWIVSPTARSLAPRGVPTPAHPAPGVGRAEKHVTSVSTSQVRCRDTAQETWTPRCKEQRPQLDAARSFSSSGPAASRGTRPGSRRRSAPARRR